MNDFYDISEQRVVEADSMQLENLGDQQILAVIGKTARGGWGEREYTSKTYYTATKPGDYDELFASRISGIKPPYETENLLEHHFRYYTSRFPENRNKFLQHIRYVILPLLKRRKLDVYIDFLKEWLAKKDETSSAAPFSQNEKLDEVLKYLASNPSKNNITSDTIHKEIFHKRISFEEAQLLHRKLLTSGIVTVIGYSYLQFSIKTSEFLRNGGFSNQISSLNEVRHLSVNNPINNSNNMSEDSKLEVFISYAWDTKEHEMEVVKFTDHLRKLGYEARIDKMISQQETATNFVTMMHKAMVQHKKVIVVLSEGYKKKAESFVGGVGEEYQLLLNDIKKQPKKYILVSFNGRSDELIPLGLLGRDIIDLSQGDEKLIRKLNDEDEYLFSEVAPKRPSFAPITIEDFRPNASLLKIDEPKVDQSDTSLFGGLYRYVRFSIAPKFSNLSAKPIDGFSYTIKLRRELIPDDYHLASQDGYLTKQVDVEKKLFPQQTFTGKEFQVLISATSLSQILETTISVTVYTDNGPVSSEFPVNTLFKLSPTNSSFMPPVPLTKDLFISQSGW